MTWLSHVVLAAAALATGVCIGRSPTLSSDYLAYDHAPGRRLGFLGWLTMSPPPPPPPPPPPTPRASGGARGAKSGVKSGYPARAPVQAPPPAPPKCKNSTAAGTLPYDPEHPISACCTALQPSEPSSRCARTETFRKAACSAKVVTDKVLDHTYHTIYGTHLLPLQKLGRPIKMMEIGLGCDQSYGPGASSSLWRKLFPDAVIWMAEFDARCVANGHKLRKFEKDKINTLVGDQSNEDTLRSWVANAGADVPSGLFDVIIDDGGHANRMILASFGVLWGALKPGGTYFIEDLQVGRHPAFNGKNSHIPVVADVMQMWIEQLALSTASMTQYGGGSFKAFMRPDDPRATGAGYPLKLPEDVAFVSCSAEACAIGKACS